MGLLEVHTFLGNIGLFKQILNGQGLPDKTVDLGDEYDNIPLVAIGDSTFPRPSWLLKNFNSNTNDEREKYYNIKMKSARAVTEICYGVLSRWLILYKKEQSKVFNFKYIIIAWRCIILCIAKHDPSNHPGVLSVEELKLNNTVIKQRANNRELNNNARKIAD